MTDKKIYIASKTKHADKWVTLRNYGFNIISTWIDSLYPDDLEELCQRCIKESLECEAMIVYAEPGDYLKGAFIEMGVALSKNTLIFLVGDPLQSGSVFTHQQNVYKANSVEHALALIKQVEPSLPLTLDAKEERIKALEEVVLELSRKLLNM